MPETGFEDLPLFAPPVPEVSESHEEKKEIKKEEPTHYSVSEITSLVKGVLEPSFVNIWVQGELSNFRPSAAGHAYFTLKDANASLSAAFFGWSRRKKFELKDGLEVLCRGKITVYPPRGSYQLTVDRIEPLGEGALQFAFEQLKKKLSLEGLFDSKHKLSVPVLPEKIVVVTSPSGAAIRDFLQVLGRRAPHVEIVILPAQVQGEGASEQIAKAINWANEKNLGDLILLTRGGGSAEDLWCFNHEELARTIFSSQIPIVSAVGHEIDFTISDFVSDLRAPTPSAAAEMLTNKWIEIATWISEVEVRLQRAVRQSVEQKKNQFQTLVPQLVSPKDALREQAQRCDELELRMTRAWEGVLLRASERLKALSGKLNVLSPLQVLDRGFSLIQDEKERIIRSAAQMENGKTYQARFSDGVRPIQPV